MEGGSAIAGATSAGAMESLQPVLEQFVKDHPDMREEAAVLIGGAVGELAGDTNAGEVAAWSSTKFNWLTHEQYEQYRKDLESVKAAADKAQVDKHWKLIDREQNNEWLNQQGYGIFYNPFQQYGDVFLTFKMNPVVIMGNRSVDIWESSMSTVIDYRVGIGVGKEIPIGSGMFASWDILNDANVNKYSIQGAARRVRLDLLNIGAMLYWTKGNPLMIATLKGIVNAPVFGEVKDKIAPPLDDKEREEKNKEFLKTVKDNPD